MNLAFGKTIGSLQRAQFFRCLNPNYWITNIIKRNVLGAAHNVQTMKRDMVQRTMYQFRMYNAEHSWMYNRPLLDLWLTNKFWNRLTKNTSDAEYHDLKEAKKMLEEYNNLHDLMHYASEL